MGSVLLPEGFGGERGIPGIHPDDGMPRSPASSSDPCVAAVLRRRTSACPSGSRVEPRLAGVMPRQFISSGSTFETQMGYSRAVVAGNWVFVSGTTGYDYSAMTISDDLAEQTAQCFANIAAALAEAGSSLDEVVRVTYVLPDGSAFEECWPAMRAAFSVAKPAAMMIEAGLSSPAMKVEIEVTALKGSSA